MNNIDECEWDIVDLVELTNDGRSLSGFAALCALDGSIEYLAFSHRSTSPTVHITPDAKVSASALLWLEKWGIMDLTDDANEAMAAQRDWLRDKDVSDGPLMGFVYAGDRS